MRLHRYFLAAVAACGVVGAAAVTSYAQMDLGPKVEKTYGKGCRAIATS